MDRDVVLLRAGQHPSLYRGTREDDGGIECLRSRCAGLVYTLTKVSGYLPAELNSLFIFWVKQIFEAVGHASLVLMLHSNGSVVEEHHSCLISALLHRVLGRRRTFVQSKS